MTKVSFVSRITLILHAVNINLILFNLIALQAIIR